jgi:CIC family chloride channel protein
MQTPDRPLPLRILGLSLVVGLSSGLAISLYVLLTQGLTHLFYGPDPLVDTRDLPLWYLYLVPTAAILLVHRLIAIDPSVREYGVAEIAQAVQENRYTITVKGLFLKIIASVLSLASGFNVGNEGPSAAIGAMIAYRFNRLFDLPRQLVTLIISLGASSGIAAVFVSPVTGITFALENIAYEFLNRRMGPIILGASLAFGVAYLFLKPLVFHYSIGRHFDYNYLIGSLIFIPVILTFLFLYLALKKWLLFFLDRSIASRLGKYRDLFFALLGGATVGTLLWQAPIAAFSGHEMVAALINGTIPISLKLLLLVIFLRILGTALAIYANAVGGLFLPLMSIGALIGYGYGEALQFYAGIPVHSYAFAAIGASVFMGVVMRLPLTAVVLALEITYDYNIIVPTAVTVVLTGFLMDRIFHLRKPGTKIT